MLGSDNFERFRAKLKSRKLFLVLTLARLLLLLLLFDYLTNEIDTKPTYSYRIVTSSYNSENQL